MKKICMLIFLAFVSVSLYAVEDIERLMVEKADSPQEKKAIYNYLKKEAEEKRKFLNLCGKRDRALLSGEKRMTLGDMERLTYLTEFFELENYGIALWKEFGDDVKEPFEAMMKMLDEPECIEDRWLDDEAKGEKWLLEFQELALTEEYREWIRNYIDKKYEERGLPYPTGADFD